VTAPVASSTLSVNVFTAPGKPMVGERPKPFGEPFAFDLNPTIVVAGHEKPGAPDSSSAIQDTKRYLEDFDRVQKNRDVRPGPVRSDDCALPGLGRQSVLVDVRIPGGVTGFQ
jgi:hypothetical protein